MISGYRLGYSGAYSGLLWRDITVELNGPNLNIHTTDAYHSTHSLQQSNPKLVIGLPEYAATDYSFENIRGAMSINNLDLHSYIQNINLSRAGSYLAIVRDDVSIEVASPNLILNVFEPAPKEYLFEGIEATAIVELPEKSVLEIMRLATVYDILVTSKYLESRIGQVSVDMVVSDPAI